MRQSRRQVTLCTLLAVSISACASLGDQEPQPVGTTGTTTGPQPVSTTAAANVVPVDQQLDVRLQTPLSSESAEVEERAESEPGPGWVPSWAAYLAA
jgi:hypothetical protein